MPKIITVTANTAIDLNIRVNNLRSTANMCALSSAEFAAGKGVNVAKALESLACPSIAMGFVGQQSMSLFSGLKSALLQPQFIPVNGQTRTNLTLHEILPANETHIRTAGFSVSAKNCAQLHRQLQGTIQKDDLVIFSGSLPEGCDAQLYAQLITQCKQQQAFTLLDSSGKSLAFGLQAQPRVIKPNLNELEEIMGKALPDEQSIIAAARCLIAAGITLVVVSRGALGTIAVNAANAFSAYIELGNRLVNSSIGCGDSMLAGLAYAMLNKIEHTEMLRLSLSCATANLFSVEPGRFSKEQMQSFMAQVILKNC